MTTTPEQWAEVVAWVNVRWPERPWLADQAVAYFYDLQEMPPEDVWSALYALYEAGRAFAPTGSELLARAREESRRQAREELYRREPALPAGEPISWSTYSESRFGEVLSPADAIQRLHAESTDCTSARCEIHQRRNR